MTVTEEELDAATQAALRKLRYAVEAAHYTDATDAQITAAIEEGVEAARANPLAAKRFTVTA